MAGFNRHCSFDKTLSVYFLLHLIDWGGYQIGKKKKEKRGRNMTDKGWLNEYPHDPSVIAKGIDAQKIFHFLFFFSSLTIPAPNTKNMMDS
jgi:hypothetical protein